MFLISCPFCGNLIIQAFQHVEYHFLVCKICFLKFLQLKIYMFERVSTLKSKIPEKIKAINIQLKNYFHKYSILDLVKTESIEEYFSNLNKSSKSTASTTAATGNIELTQNMQIQQTEKIEQTSKFEAVRSKISQKYTTLQESVKQSETFKNNLQKYQKCKQKLSQSKVQISNKLKHFKDQFKNIKSELPALKDIKIGSFIKSNLFKWK